MNLNDSNIINGKTLTKPETNLLNTLVEKYGWQVFSATHGVVVNYLSGAKKCIVDPKVGALIDFAQKAYLNYERSPDFSMVINGVKVPISFYDRVRYLVLKLDNKAYYAILDWHEETFSNDCGMSFGTSTTISIDP